MSGAVTTSSARPRNWTARKRPFKLKAPVVPEHSNHKQIADVLRLELAPAGKVSKHGVVWWSIDHANYAGEVPGIRMGRGIIAGIADIYIVYQGRAYHPEVKTPDGVLSEAQKAVAAAVICAGGKVGFVIDAADMIELLDAWAIPRARRVAI